MCYYIKFLYLFVLQHNPFGNLESYMNWDPDAWNKRPWVVAQGEGLFKHADANNFGGGHG